MTLVTMIVEDDKLTQLIHKKVLEKTGIGASPKVFSDGEQALTYLLDAYCAENSYLIFLDINMPVMNGWSFLEEVSTRFTERNIHVVLVSSSVSSDDRFRANAYQQVLKYLEKPLTMDTLKLLNRFVQANHQQPLE